MLNTKPRVILIIACSMFLAFGMFNAAIGPVLGELAANTGTTLAMVGVLSPSSSWVRLPRNL